MGLSKRQKKEEKMPKFSFGEESWDKSDDPQLNDSGSLFLRVNEEGTYIVRVVSKPWRYNIHWTKDALGKKKKIKCPGEGCPVCEKVKREMPAIEASGKKGGHNEQRKPRWIFTVIDRKDGKIKLIEQGPQVIRGIRAQTEKKAFAHPEQYDIEIKTNPNSKNEYYTVSVAIDDEANVSKYPLTDAEKKMIESFLDRVDISKMVVPDTVDKIKDILGISDDDVDEEIPASKPDGSDDDDDDLLDFDDE